jgi:hypothetical protein
LSKQRDCAGSVSRFPREAIPQENNELLFAASTSFLEHELTVNISSRDLWISILILP